MTRTTLLCLATVAASLCPLTAQAQEPVEFHGFASQAFLWSHHNKYLAPDANKGSFQYNEVGLNAISQLTDNLRVGIQLFARNLGEFGKDTVSIDWAYGDYRWRDWLGLRVGKIKLPLGLYNETRDVDSLRTNVLMPQAVYDEGFREMFLAAQGVGLYGHVPLRWLGSLSYQVYAASVTIPEGGSTARGIEMLSGGTFKLRPSSNVRSYGGQLVWDTPLRGLRLAASGAQGSWTMAGTSTALATPLPAGQSAMLEFDDYLRMIYSIEFVWRSLTLASEYQRTGGTMNSAIDVTGLGMPVNTLAKSSKKTNDGFYVSAAYRFASWFELGAYYSAAYADVDDRDGSLLEPGQPSHNGYQKDIALSLRFDIANGWCVKLEGHRLWGASLVGYEVTDTVKDWTFFAAKASYSF